MIIKSLKYNKIIIGIIFLASVTCLFTFIILNNNKNASIESEINYIKQVFGLELHGESIMRVEVHSDYIELGAKVDGDIEEVDDYLTIDASNLDTSIIDTYKVVYTLNYNDNVHVAERTVIVEDTTSPIISLASNKELYINIGDSYIEPGFTAFDNYDGDITDKVLVENNVNTSKLGRYSINYTVTDESGNETCIERIINVVDNSKPLIELNGDNNIYIEYPNKYVEPGFIATDKIDGDITNKVIVTSNVDTTKLGTYKVNYSASNSRGVVTVVTRNVIVQDTKNPIVTGVKDGDVINHDVTISFNEGFATLNGREILSNTTVSEEGAYTLIVTDIAGNKNIITFRILKTAQKLEIYSEGTLIENNGQSFDDVRINMSTIQFARYLIINNEKISINNLEENKIINLNQQEDGSAGYVTVQNGYVIIGTNYRASTSFTIRIEDAASNVSNTVTFSINKVPTSLVNFNIYSSNINNQAAKLGDEITLEFETDDSSELNFCDVQILGIPADVQVIGNKYVAKVTVTDTIADNQIVSYVINYKDNSGRTGEQITNNSSIVVYTNLQSSISYSTNVLTKDNVTVTITTSHLINTPNGFTKIDDITYIKEYADNILEDINIEDIAGNVNTLNVNINNILKIVSQSVSADKVNSKNELPSYLKFVIKFNRDITLKSLVNFRVYYEYSLDGQNWIQSKYSSSSYKSLSTYNMLYLNGVKWTAKTGDTIQKDTEIMTVETSAQTRLKDIYNAIIDTSTNGGAVYNRNVIGIIENNVEVKYPLNTVIYTNGGKTVSYQ